MNLFVQSAVIAILLGAYGGDATDATTADGKAGSAKAVDRAKAGDEPKADGDVPPEVTRKLKEETRALASVGNARDRGASGGRGRPARPTDLGCAILPS